VIQRANGLPGGGRARLVREPQDAVAGACAVYTDVWASMGHESELAGRIEAFRPYTDDVIESERSAVFDQAENRMHAQQAVLALVLGDARP
jgi:ornithine carbamoyltransferase